MVSYPALCPFERRELGKDGRALIAAIAARDYYRSITTEELSTYFKEVEGILNWRPLTSVSSSSNDFDYLSP